MAAKELYPECNLLTLLTYFSFIQSNVVRLLTIFVGHHAHPS